MAVGLATHQPQSECVSLRGPSSPLHCLPAWLVCAYVSACRLGRFRLPIHHRDSLPATLTASPRLLFPYAECVCLPISFSLSVRSSLAPSPSVRILQSVWTFWRAYTSISVVISQNCTPQDSSINLTGEPADALFVQFKYFPPDGTTGRCGQYEQCLHNS